MRLPSYERPAADNGLGVRLKASTVEAVRQAAGRGAKWAILPCPVHLPPPWETLAEARQRGLEPLVALQVATIDGSQSGLARLVHDYARAGVHYLWAYEYPNASRSWGWSGWSQPELVARFAAILLPFLERAAEAGLYPTLPPLEPGGDYWDTLFLSSLLRELVKAGRLALFDRLAVAAVLDPDGRPLDWGRGGPERWKDARPYRTSETVQDQRGFRLFEWYQAIIRQHVGHSLPILGARVRANPVEAAQIRELLAAGQLPDYLFCLALEERDEPLPVSGQGPPEEAAHLQPNGANGVKPLHHYLLLPQWEWGASEWHWRMVGDYVKKFRPATGFNPDEARLARHVTILGGLEGVGREVERTLERAGCRVERLGSSDGGHTRAVLEELVRTGRRFQRQVDPAAFQEADRPPSRREEL